MSVQRIPCDGLSKKYCVLLRFQFGVTQQPYTYCSGFYYGFSAVVYFIGR